MTEFNSGDADLDARNEEVAAAWRETLKHTIEGPDPLDFGDDPEAQKAYDERLSELRSRAAEKAQAEGGN